MNALVKEGFLADSIQDWVEDGQQKKLLEISFSKEANMVAQSIFCTSQPSGDRGALIAALFARSLEHFQAIIILEEKIWPTAPQHWFAFC